MAKLQAGGSIGGMRKAGDLPDYYRGIPHSGILNFRAFMPWKSDEIYGIITSDIVGGSLGGNRQYCVLRCLAQYCFMGRKAAQKWGV